jgi:hypothetical protein
MTFDQLCELEPRLRQLAREAKSVRDDGTAKAFCANAAWYGYFGNPGIKPRLLLLVGFERPNGPDELRTTEAYDVAYDAIYNMLPDCRGECGCMRLLG